MKLQEKVGGKKVRAEHGWTKEQRRERKKWQPPNMAASESPKTF